MREAAISNNEAKFIVQALGEGQVGCVRDGMCGAED